MDETCGDISAIESTKTKLRPFQSSIICGSVPNSVESTRKSDTDAPPIGLGAFDRTTGSTAVDSNEHSRTRQR